MINEEYSPAAKQAFDKVKQGMLGNVSKLFDKYKNPDAIIYGRARKELKKVQDMENTNKLKEAIKKALIKEIDPEAGVERYEAEQDLSQANDLIKDTEILLSRLKNKALPLYQRGENYYIHAGYPQYAGRYNPYRIEQDVNSANKEIQKLVDEIVNNIKEIQNISGYEKDASNLFNRLENIFRGEQERWKEDKYYSYSDDSRSYEQGSIQNYYKKMLDMFVNQLNLMGSIAEKFPDLTGDGKVTRADILKGRGVELEEDLDLGHEDDEPHMIKAELYKIGKYAMELYQMVDQFEGPGEVDFPAWWQSKITNAASMISSAKHYLEFELKEPAIDAMVGVAQSEDVIDENKINALEEIKAKVLEKLTAKTPMKTYIKDFAKSDAPQFKGKTKEKKRQMAVAAKLSK